MGGALSVIGLAAGPAYFLKRFEGLFFCFKRVCRLLIFAAQVMLGYFYIYIRA
ncbi:hypothetical protein DET1319 [Dehalococcoides mccartyi 195]|uniref:Uncharacterized protein n=1 Tax=Dehalococcoides mccartyi (strain ATCC BAA-2266 / KCTC 15142 / 195) TaxID=243164 RepID=Q3Z6W9_DEHM1|nr:hypothetical protein DET1319 [Dehalococcoides mccartyi 195]